MIRTPLTVPIPSPGENRVSPILAPKVILRQWQVELCEKFNLDWPIYDGRKLSWYPSPAWRGRSECNVRMGIVPASNWEKDGVVANPQRKKYRRSGACRERLRRNLREDGSFSALEVLF